MMIQPSEFLNELAGQGINFFSGVPDSLMKGLNYQISNSYSAQDHVITSNEGSAVAQAIGHYAATKHLSAVYMQNSGLGNAYNPLISLADPAVYGIPMILLIGWRGEILDSAEQLKDEPQHIKQGRITLGSLDVMDIPFEVIDANDESWKQKIHKLVQIAQTQSRPVAVVFRKNTFMNVTLNISEEDQNATLEREAAIEKVVNLSCLNDVFVASTGMIGRELFEIRKRNSQSHAADFLTVGGMGHASQIACGIAAACPDRRVICLDGDGALLMHTGGMAECARYSNLVHIVLNNGAHDSVGGQPTMASQIDLQKIADGFGYKRVSKVVSDLQLEESIAATGHGSMFVEVICKRGSRSDLGRPDKLPRENLRDFMKSLEDI